MIIVHKSIHKTNGYCSGWYTPTMFVGLDVRTAPHTTSTVRCAVKSARVRLANAAAVSCLVRFPVHHFPAKWVCGLGARQINLKSIGFTTSSVQFYCDCDFARIEMHTSRPYQVRAIMELFAHSRTHSVAFTFPICRRSTRGEALHLSKLRLLFKAFLTLDITQFPKTFHYFPLWPRYLIYHFFFGARTRQNIHSTNTSPDHMMEM